MSVIQTTLYNLCWISFLPTGGELQDHQDLLLLELLLGVRCS